MMHSGGCTQSTVQILSVLNWLLSTDRYLVGFTRLTVADAFGKIFDFLTENEYTNAPTLERPVSEVGI